MLSLKQLNTNVNSFSSLMIWILSDEAVGYPLTDARVVVEAACLYGCWLVPSCTAMIVKVSRRLQIRL